MSGVWTNASDDICLNFAMVYRWTKTAGVYTMYYISNDFEWLPAACTPNLDNYLRNADANPRNGIVRLSDSEGINLENVIKANDNGTVMTLSWPNSLSGTGYIGADRDKLRAAMGV